MAFLLLAGLVAVVPAQAQSPKLVSATGSFSTVTLTYDRTLNASSGLAASDFTTSVGTIPSRYTQPTAPGVTNVAVNGSTVVLTMDAPYPLVAGYIFNMDIKHSNNRSRLQAQDGTQADSSCGQPHIPFPRVSHYRLIGCKWVRRSSGRGVYAGYKGTGMPVTLTSGNLGQLVAEKNKITGIQISEAGSDNQWTNDETVNITVTFGGTAKFTSVPSVWTPGWCQNKATSRPHSNHAPYKSGRNSASLVFQCTIINGPHTSLRIAPNSVHDAKHTLRVSGTITEYSYDFNPLADLRHGAVVRQATSMQVVAPTITGSPALSEAGADGTWTADETVEVTLTFSEAVTVDTTGGTPSIGLDLGGTESRSATYLRGSGTTALVFGYTLTATDGEHTSLLVPGDSLALNGGTIRSQATSADAGLGHLGAAKAALPPVDNQGQGTRDEGDGFTASFGALPESHDGSGPFTFELHFSEAPEGLSYTTVAGGLLDVTGATVTKARRLTAGSNLGWEVTVTPSQSGDIAIRLPARACTETNAVCVGGSPLGEAVAATVPGVPFTASFSRVPAEHDGATAFDIRFHLSAEPAVLSYRTVQNGLFEVTGGSIEKANRLVRGKSNGWNVRIDPSGLGDVTVGVKATTACDTAPGVCTADGRKLPGDLQIVIAGPAAFSVADAQVQEGADATLDFVVTLSKARFTATTVNYATSNDTATAGSDYTSTSGTLTFGLLETSKTVSVPVLVDVHDEGSETLTLTLSNPNPATVLLADATATGSIANTGVMPDAWLGRFGRTVAEQVIGAVEGRFAGQPAAGVEVTLAGERIGGDSAAADPQTWDEAAPRAGLRAMSDWLHGGTEEAGKARAGWRSVTSRELLTGSSFALTAEVDGGSGGAVSLWGRAAVSGFDGRDGDLSLDGEVVSGMLGTDWRRGPWTAGLLVSHSSGDGGYRSSAGGDGKVESTLTGVYPYGRYEVNPRFSVWGVAGYGTGSLTLTPPMGGKPLETDMDLMMAAVGLRGVAFQAPAEGGVELAVKSDAMAVRTTSAAVRGSAADGTGNLAEGTARVTRFRLGVEGTWRGLGVGSGEVTPGIEIGVRHDGGDAETGSGLDLGAGLAWSDPKLGIQAEIRGHGLLTHESKGFRERGLSGSFAWGPKQATGRGPKLTLTQTLGGVDALLGRKTLAGLAASDSGDGGELWSRRFELKSGYGFSALGGGFTSTPEIGIGLSDTGRDYSLGWRLTRVAGDSGSLELSFEARRENANDNAGPEHTIGFRLTTRF